MPATIKQHLTIAGYISDVVLAYFGGLLLALGVTVVTDSRVKAYGWLNLWGVIVLLGIVARYYSMRGRLQKRDRLLADLASQKKWQYQREAGESLKLLGDPALLRIKTVRGQRYRNFIRATDFMYADFSYALYGDMKGYEYQRAIVDYSITSLELPRALPNVVFDSLKSRGQQFKTVYAQNQRHQLEGNFDKYFATYFIKDYTIDSLSFITPEVMEALIAASDYDIEIRDDRLLLYGPLLLSVQQLQTMNDLAQAIKKELRSNILAYRDDRETSAKAAQTVAVAGRRLKAKGFDLRHLIIFNVVPYAAFAIYDIYSHH